jgi:hypothetical protein
MVCSCTSVTCQEKKWAALFELVGCSCRVACMTNFFALGTQEVLMHLLLCLRCCLHDQ